MVSEFGDKGIHLTNGNIEDLIVSFSSLNMICLCHGTVILQ
jgi:hypothetical protein